MNQPSRHRSHVAEPSLDVYAAPTAVSHRSQVALPFVGANLPSSQTAHWADPGSDDSPAGQAEHEAAPAAAAVPAVQVSQPTLPWAAAWVPLGQTAQARPSAEWLPAAQSSQDAAPAGAAVPGAQPSQATAPLVAACRPSGQLVQVSAALAPSTVPGAHRCLSAAVASPHTSARFVEPASTARLSPAATRSWRYSSATQSAPRSAEACLRHGVNPEVLRIRPLDSFHEIDLDPVVQRMRHEVYTKRRFEMMRLARAERKKVRRVADAPRRVLRVAEDPAAREDGGLP